ncbi:MAG: TlpA family protein disulfide reductase [Bryobacteraceae bacterium]
MNTKTLDRALKAAIGLLIMAFAVIVVQTVRERVVTAGDTAPNFSIKTDTGRTVTRSDFGGRLLVLNFWATWCAPCIEELPSLNQFAKTMKDQGVVVLAISADQDAAVYRRFLQRVPVSFETAWDPHSDISADYGTFQFPETYIIDAQGKVLEKVISNRNWMDPEVVKSVRGMLAGT